MLRTVSFSRPHFIFSGGVLCIAFLTVGILLVEQRHPKVWTLSVLIPPILYFICRQLEWVPSPSQILRSLKELSGQAAQNLKAGIQKEDRVHLVALLLVITVAVILRWMYLEQPIRGDEARTYHLIANPSFSFPYVLSYSQSINNHPLNSVLIYLLTSITGKADLATIRMPTFISGILMVPFIYLVGRVLYNKHIGLMTAGFTAIAPQLILFSTNARGYTLVTLAFVILLSLAHYLIRHRSSGAWLLFVCVGVAGFYTIPLMLYPFAIVATWLGLSFWFEHNGQARWLRIRDLVIASAFVISLTIIAYVPILIESGLSRITANKWTAPLSYSEFSAGFPEHLLEGAKNWGLGVPTIILIFFIIAYLYGLYKHRIIASHLVPLILPTVIVLGIIFLAQRPNLQSPRWFLFLAPIITLTIVTGLYSFILDLVPYSMPIRHISAYIFTGILMSGIIWYSAEQKSVLRSTQTAGVLPDAEAIIVDIANDLQPDDYILAPIPQLHSILWYYLKMHGFNEDRTNTSLKGIQPDRLFLILRRKYKQEKAFEVINQYLGAEQIPLYSQPKLVRNYERNSLAVIERIRE